MLKIVLKNDNGESTPLYNLRELRQSSRGELLGEGGGKSAADQKEGEDRAVSTFLKETDLAGLKVCSSPSIVSVQSERGASCNSKLSHQSTPGPTLKISTKKTE